MKRSTTLIAVAAFLFLGGCASTSSSTSEMESLREMAQQAMSRAQAAESKAQQASSQAARASRDAAAAMKAAQEAQACCQANTQRINRAFEESMKK